MTSLNIFLLSTCFHWGGIYSLPDVWWSREEGATAKQPQKALAWVVTLFITFKESVDGTKCMFSVSFTTFYFQGLEGLPDK